MSDNDLVVAVRAFTSAGGDGSKCSITFLVFWIVLCGFPCWRSEDELWSTICNCQRLYGCIPSTKLLRPGLAPRHRNTTTYTGKLSAWFSCLCQLGVSQMFSSLEARIIQGPFPKALSVPGSRFGQKFILIMDVGKTGSRESLGIIYWYRCSPWVHLLKEGFGNG